MNPRISNTWPKTYYWDFPEVASELADLFAPLGRLEVMSIGTYTATVKVQLKRPVEITYQQVAGYNGFPVNKQTGEVLRARPLFSFNKIPIQGDSFLFFTIDLGIVSPVQEMSFTEEDLKDWIRQTAEIMSRPWHFI